MRMRPRLASGAKSAERGPMTISGSGVWGGFSAGVEVEVAVELRILSQV